MVDRSNSEQGVSTDAESGNRKRGWSRFSLRNRLLLLTAVALLPAFVIVLANNLTSRALRSAEVDAYALKMTEVVQNEVIRGLSAAATLMIGMGRSEIVTRHDAAACQSYTDSIRRDLVTIVDIAVADVSGQLYCRSGDTSAADLQHEVDALVAGQPGRLVVGGFTQTTSGPALPIGLAQTSADGKVQGYIVLNVDMAELVAQLTAATKDVPSSRTTVTDRNGVVLLSLPQGNAQADSRYRNTSRV